MAVHGEDWLESVCMQLCIDGRDRPNVRKALKAFQTSGLIAYDGAGLVNFCFLPGAQLVTSVAPPSNVGPTTVERPSNDRRTTVELPSNIPRESNPQNDSGRVLQTDRRDRQTDETEKNADASVCARVPDRPDLVGYKFVASLLGRSEFDVPPLGAFARQYTWIGSRPEAERATVKLAIDSDPWCRANKHLVDAKHLEGRWQRYLGGAPKPVVRAVGPMAQELLQTARERLTAAQRDVNRLDNAPWFDKEASHFPDRVARAAAELKAARAALNALTAPQAVAS
jgi:hypothetical protein